MRKILSILSDIRRGQLSERGAESPRLGPVVDLFESMDRGLSGISSSANNEDLLEVMISADFTYAIMEFVQRKMLPGYEERRFEFEPLVKMDTVPNFLSVTRYQNRAGVDDLEYVGEKGQARPGYVTDAVKRTWQVYRFEKQYDFSYEAFKNDDLGYFDDVAQKMGRAARRTLERYVSRMYTNAVSIARLAGVVYSTTGRLTTARWSTCRMAFFGRTDTRGSPILVEPKYLVHHIGLTDTVATIQNSLLVPELATNAANVIRGTFTPIADPHMAGTAPNLPWYGFSAPSQLAALVLARMDGMPGPRIYRKKSDIEAVTALLGAGAAVDPILGDFDTGNVVLKVADVWGTYIDVTNGNLVDRNGAYYSSGTAP